MKKLYPLTDEERDMAEKHIALVDRFLRMKRLSPDEYWDIVILGYIEAIQKHCRVPIEAERQNFPALARICMEHSVGEDWKYRNAAKRKGSPVSLDVWSADTDDGVFSFYDIIPDRKEVVEQKVADRDLIERIMAEATPRQKEAISYICCDFEPCEMSEILNITQDTGRRTLANFRMRARAVRDGREVMKSPFYDPEKARVRNRKYHQSHKEERRVYEAANRDHINALRRARYAKQKVRLGA